MTPCRFARLLDQTHGSLERDERIFFEPEGQREVEHHLGVGRALHVGEQLRVDREHQVPPKQVEVRDEAVVHEQPVAAAERVAVGLLHGRADRGPHVRHEQRRLDMRSQLAEVGVPHAGETLR